MCKTKVHCYNCKGSHHTLLCQGSKPKSNSSDSTSKPKHTTTPNPTSIKNPANEQPVNQLETHSVITSRMSTLASNGGGGTALLTAILRLKTRVSSKVVNTVRCFFDSGSGSRNTIYASLARYIMRVLAPIHSHNINSLAFLSLFQWLYKDSGSRNTIYASLSRYIMSVLAPNHAHNINSLAFLSLSLNGFIRIPAHGTLYMPA